MFAVLNARRVLYVEEETDVMLLIQRDFSLDYGSVRRLSRRSPPCIYAVEGCLEMKLLSQHLSPFLERAFAE